MKFFERRKLERGLRQAHLALAGAKAPEEKQALQAKVALLGENLEVYSLEPMRHTKSSTPEGWFAN